MKWYYVQDNEKVGPVSLQDIGQFIKEQKLGRSDYVWTKGFENWKRIYEIPDLEHFFEAEALENEFDWNDVDHEEKIFFILTGKDRGNQETLYGPYSFNILKKLYKEKRISAKTYIWTSGMVNWEFIADIPPYQDVFEDVPPQIDELERRENVRRPFLARMLFHNNSQLFEGICRDISLGGMQVLVPEFPGTAGDSITFNVHPENTEYSFVAKGKIVRVLEGQQGFSFRFSELNNEAKNAIVKYINSEAS